MQKLLLILLIPAIIVGCASSRIFMNADIPKDTEVNIEISTKKKTD
tara:strand:- start:442 stop:579 length:138 start_codon:yes stop_codon:yes gene_type:complete